MDFCGSSEREDLLLYHGVSGKAVGRVDVGGEGGLVGLDSSQWKGVVLGVLLVDLTGGRSGLEGGSVPVSSKDKAAVILELLKIRDCL